MVALTFFPLLVAALDCYSFCFSSKSDPEFLELNPLALISILVDGDFVLAESLAIIMYLDDKYPQYPLLPHDVPKRALNFQVGPHEKLPWAQSVIRKGFTALEKLLKDHARRYATGDEIFLVLAIHMTMLSYYYYTMCVCMLQDHLEDFNWCCRGKCNPTAHSRAAPLGMNKEMNTDTIVKAKSFLDSDEDQHEKDVFEKNLKALQKIF
ncbi:hypothetical protein Ahy_B03g065003 [Arachis hypogaea]|uniref:GST N-terminal domain-containing protein n=1 Tax=Arachis hypogaea TaxID=3818 RepID=A0A445A0L8_ARAHY|nr:hypothetical protein Ahy_B03g065003 [Arachis hypogaea]